MSALDEADHGAAALLLTRDVAETFEDLLRVVATLKTTDDLAYVLADLRDLRATVALVYAEVEKALLGAMGDKLVTVPGLGVVEGKKKTKRTKWQHDDLFRSVVSRLADQPGVFYDPETGSMLPPAQMAANLVASLRDVLSPSWKVTGIRAIGLDEEEFCQVEPDGYGVQLPPRSIEERVA